ncbi:unnamed protein product, partial [marine sediment metagenome]
VLMLQGDGPRQENPELGRPGVDFDCVDLLGC